MGAITYPRTYGRSRGKWWQKRNCLYLSIATRSVIVVYKLWRFERIQYQKRKREEYEQLRKEFSRKHRSEFLKRIAREERDFLTTAGFGQTDFKLMEQGRPPRGYQVHHKIPIDDGGDNSESNFLLIRNSPEHTALTSYQSMATKGMKDGEVRDLHFPVPEQGVFLHPPTTAPSETLALWPPQKR